MVALSLGALPREDHLIARRAARPLKFSVVATAVHLSVLIEVDEVTQELRAAGARETLRVPAGAQARPGCKYRDITTADLMATLIAYSPIRASGDGTHRSAPKVLEFPFLAKQRQQLLLFLSLAVMWG